MSISWTDWALLAGGLVILFLAWLVSAEPSIKPGQGCGCIVCKGRSQG